MAAGTERCTSGPRMTGIRPRRATLADVASRAGVSAVTVSRVLRRPGSGLRRAAPARRRRRRRAGLYPQPDGERARPAQTDTIGVVAVPSLTNGVSATICAAFTTC
mgnify:CR=1 FL=1